MDESLNIIYINEKLDRSEWKTFEVGHTRFNDEALRQVRLSAVSLPGCELNPC